MYAGARCARFVMPFAAADHARADRCIRARSAQNVPMHDGAALNHLLPQVYDELKRIAHRQLVRLRPGGTLSTTVLVHEMYERLAASRSVPASDRVHFFALCARAMRQVIIDHARQRDAAKRGGGAAVFELSDADLADAAQPDAIVALDQALLALEALDPRLVRVIELRLFAGLEPPQMADLLGVNLRTVQRDWQRARAWLATALM
jgi:RNA polymerase sigma factor (TIGR02999 family)